MNNLNCLIIGFGSSGKRYSKILSKIFSHKNIFVLTNYKKCNFKIINDISEIKKINFQLIIVTSETYKHYTQLKFIEKNFKGKLVLVEKPLFHKYQKDKFDKNYYYVGYNLRFDPIIIFLKKYLNKKKINLSVFNCFSNLPSWRKNTNYRLSYSASIKKGGGVTRDLSHEIDLANYLIGIKKIKYAVNSKISNLKIDSDDFANMHCIGKNNTQILINLNFFSEIEIRNIFFKISGETIFVDLLNRYIIIAKNKQKKKIYFKKKKNLTYEELIKDLLTKKKIICTFKQALKINSFIDTFKKI